jgi:hypothetical protein
MTTIAAGRLSDTLQNLVDARLDTIDRMLLGRVNRNDRLAIVREVETQIFDQLLQGRDPESLDRDDVLAVLSRLDPPEAYLSDEATGEVVPARLRSPSRTVRPTPEVQIRLPKASGIVGIVSVVPGLIAIMCYVILIGSNLSGGLGTLVEFVLFGSIAVTFILGLLAVVLAAMSGLRGSWAITGFVTGLISMLGTMLGTFAIFAE